MKTLHRQPAAPLDRTPSRRVRALWSSYNGPRQRFRSNGPDDVSADRESGSLILDILIGMAIFALIAIIAISAIGQYRMRAYVQTAMSDAEATANAMSAAFTDMAQDEDFDGYVDGNLTAADLSEFGVTPTGAGTGRESLVSIYTLSAERFEVCVEHKGAMAVYDSDAGLVESGPVDEVGYGCDMSEVEPPTTPECGTWNYSQDEPYVGVGYTVGLDWPAEVNDAWDAPGRPDFTDTGFFIPAHIPGLTESEWTAWREARLANSPDESPGAVPGSWKAVHAIYGASDWTFAADGSVLDGTGTPVLYDYCWLPK